MTNPIVPLPVRTLRSGKVFLEDGTKQTRNYVIISSSENNFNFSKGKYPTHRW